MHAMTMKNQFGLARRCLLALLFSGLLAGHASAQLFWSGAGLNPATAGSGTWDNTNMQWSSTFPSYTAAMWDSNIANFNGTGGGTVTIGASISISAINFGANAGAFTLLNSAIAQTILVDGAGITNNSANIQTITNSGASSSTLFFNSATAANATITNSGSTSETIFFTSATAANATITNSGTDSSTIFNDSTTAANATITNNGATSGTGFFNSATAANASITNSGTDSFTAFFNSATAANASITNSASNSETDFFTSATAANATITNSGSFSGTFFFDSASGGNASLINANPTAFIDISTLATTGTTAGSIAGNGFLNLGSKNLAVGGNNTSTTFSGVIQDGGGGGGMGGSLTKVGTGALTLSGINTYTGVTNINAGSLIVDGSIASPDTEVNFGGLLGGTGTIGGFVINAGVVSPGDSPGTLTINGNYVEVGSSTLRIEIGGLNSGVNSDLLQVNGAGGASLAGTLQLIRINNFMPMSGERVTIINDASGHDGTMFSAVDLVNWGLIRPVPMYNEPADVYVVFQLSTPFASQGLTPNQVSVGRALDRALSDNCVPDLTTFVGSITPLSALPHVYDLIAPEELAAMYEISFSRAVVQNNNLQRRMDDIRAGSNGFCANGFAPKMIGQGYGETSGGKSESEKNVAPVMQSCPDNPWGVFVTGSGDFVNVGQDDSNARGYDITTGDFTLGVDYRIGEHFAIGIDGGYSAGTADLVDDGQVEVDGGKIGGYATIFGKGFFGSKVHVDLAGSGGWNSYDTRRTGLQDMPVRGNTDGSEFNALLAYGSDWTFNCLNIGTWSTLQYTRVSIDKFTEKGSLAPLEIQDQDEDSFRATTGIRASYDIKAGRCMIIRPEVRAAWQHEYNDRAYAIDARFIDCPNTFTVHGPEIGRDAALVGAGLNVQWSSRVSTYVYYDGVLGRDNYDKNSVSGGLRISF